LNIESFYKEIGIELKKTGDRWKSICPFHKELDASFVVYPDGSFHCFGCGAHGKAKDIQDLYDIDFRTIVDIFTETKDHVTEKVDTLKSRAETELSLILIDCTQKVKFKLYDMFDSLFIDVKSLADRPEATLLEVATFVHRGMRKISKLVENQ